MDGDNQVFEWLWFYELTTSCKQSRMSSKDLWHTGAKIRDGCQDQNFLRLLNEQTNLTNKVREFFVRSVRMIE